MGVPWTHPLGPIGAWGKHTAALGRGSEGERLTYRGYILEIRKHPVGWRLGISPLQSELPILANHNFRVPYPRKDELSPRLVSG
jgi:hypothetical protein